MYIDSFSVGYPLSKMRPIPKERMRHAHDFRIDIVPDYNVIEVDVTWIDSDGAEHEEPLSQELLDRTVAAGETDEQTLKHLRDLLAKQHGSPPRSSAARGSR